MGRIIQIDTFCRYYQVSRETIRSLVEYELMLINANKKGEISLTKNQLIGIKYRKDLVKRIPRNEINNMKIINSVIRNDATNIFELKSTFLR